MSVADGGAGTILMEALFGLHSQEASQESSELTLERIGTPTYLPYGGDYWCSVWQKYTDKDFHLGSEPRGNDVHDHWQKQWEQIGDRIKMKVDWSEDSWLNNVMTTLSLLQPFADPDEWKANTKKEIEEALPSLFDDAYRRILDFLLQEYEKHHEAFKEKHKEEPVKHILVFSGGQSEDTRLCDRLTEEFEQSQGKILILAKHRRFNIMEGLWSVQGSGNKIPRYRHRFGWWGMGYVSNKDKYYSVDPRHPSRQEI